MDWWLPTPAQVEWAHDAVLNPGELPGRARDKSLEATLARVDNRIAYGLVGDVFDLAALYAMAIAQGHCFNDANKRTAFRIMVIVLQANGAGRPAVSFEEMGNRIIALAQGLTDEVALADWLRERAG